jgi:signal recognition particle receptor subunit beta
VPFINHSEREIVCKIVYAGPAYSGKTTSLEWIAGQAGKSDGRKVVSVATEGERTLFFDFFALDLGRVGGYTVRLQLFTVPGQPKYEAARRIVLRGADAVIFVADSQRARMMDNVQALTALEQALLDEGFAPGEAPLVLQYNKQDLRDSGTLSSTIDMDCLLNPANHPRVLTDALHGTGIQDALRDAVRLVLQPLAAPANDRVSGAHSIPVA